MKVFKLLAKALFRALGYYPTSLNGLKFKCDPYHIGFWRQASTVTWEPHIGEDALEHFHSYVFLD